MEIPSFSDIWDSFLEGLEYWTSGEVFSDIGEYFSGFFENLGELSFAGAIYGVIVVVLVYMFREQVFVMIPNVFLQIPFYLVAFVIGYLSGRRLWD